MRIDTLLKRKTTYSAEFYPPRDATAQERLDLCQRRLSILKADFASITYGAGGSTRTKTLEVATAIQARLPVLHHLTCIGHTAQELECAVQGLLQHGISNVLALRGDDPKDGPSPPSYLPDAAALVYYLSHYPDFCIGVAGYPEKHPKAETLASDIDALARKIDAGAHFVITQLFYDNGAYFRFRDLAQKRGITVPIIPGILPILSAGQAKRLPELFSSALPPELFKKIERWQGDDEAVANEGIAWAIRQCDQLLEEDAPGVHLYTMNKPFSSSLILQYLHQKKG